MVKYLTREDAEWNEELTADVIKCRILLQKARALKKEQWRKGRFKPLTAKQKRYFEELKIKNKVKQEDINRGLPF